MLLHTMNGRGPSKLLRTHRHPDKRRRAVLAADVADGRPFQPSLGQLARIFGVSVTYIRTAQRFSPAKRDLKGKDGTSFTPLVKKPTTHRVLPAPATDDELVELARTVGPERLFSAIKRSVNHRNAARRYWWRVAPLSGTRP
jgi:hypothetical protein